MFKKATEHLLDQIDCNPYYRETIEAFLMSFAEYILWHTTPAAGSTIKKFQRMTIEEIAHAIPDMEEIG